MPTNWREISAVLRNVDQENGLTDGEFRYWMLVRSYENGKHGGCTASQETIAAQLRIDPRNARARKAELIKKGYLTDEHRGPRLTRLMQTVCPDHLGVERAHLTGLTRLGQRLRDGDSDRMLSIPSGAGTGDSSQDAEHPLKAGRDARGDARGDASEDAGHPPSKGVRELKDISSTEPAKKKRISKGNGAAADVELRRNAEMWMQVVRVGTGKSEKLNPRRMKIYAARRERFTHDEIVTATRFVCRDPYWSGKKTADQPADLRMPERWMTSDDSLADRLADALAIEEQSKPDERRQCWHCQTRMDDAALEEWHPVPDQTAWRCRDQVACKQRERQPVAV